MEWVYVIVLVLHAQAGADRVAVIAPGEWDSKASCEAAAKELDQQKDNRGEGILNSRCIKVPKR